MATDTRTETRTVTSEPPPRLSRTPGRLIATLVGVLVLVSLVNGLIFALGWAGPETGAAGQAQPLLPPGWVIGAVWTALLAAMAVAHWWLGAEPRAQRARRWLAVLIVFCIAYPFYTLGFSSPQLMLAGNVATVAFAALLTGRLLTLSPLAAALIAPTVAWAAFATYASAAP
jgi:tryptophan-rich sensory protein